MSLLEKYHTILEFIQNSGKSEEYWSKLNQEIEKALENGDWDTFEKLYSGKNPFINFNSWGCKVAINGNFELYKKLEDKAIKEQQNSELFYKNCVSWSLARDNIEIIQDIYQSKPEYIHFSNNDFKIIIENGAKENLNFLLYDIHFPVDQSLQNWLKEEAYYDIIEQINKRDLLFSLNNSLTTQETKHKSLKI